jgi:hypothetical protein
MSDLGSKAALQADIDAKVTTNGNGENTGARVRAALTNMVDTLSNGENLSVTPYLYLTSGSKTGIYRYAGVYEGKGAWVLNGVTFDPLDPHDSVIWVTGEGWYVTDANTDPLYFSASDVATPDLATGWTLDQGTGPLPSIAGYPGPTVQDALEQVAAKPAPFMDYTTPPAAYDGLALLGGAITGGAGGVTLNLTTLIPGITAAKFVNGFSIEGVPFFAMPGGGGLTDFVALFLDTAGDPAGNGNECSVIIAYKL